MRASQRTLMPLDWRSKLIHPHVSIPPGFRSLATPVYRGSTTLFENAARVTDHWDREVTPYSYGLYGTPTTFELAARIAQLEGGAHCFITPGGQAAIALIDLAFTRCGGHVLIPDSVYGPSRELADRLLLRFGVTPEYYDPMIGGGIERLLRPTTQLLWCESPGSVTMEVQDVPAIARVARAAGVVSAIDNTYAAGVFFDAFRAGVDVTMQALTKYIGGHSDVLLGSVTVREPHHYQLLGDAHQLLGLGVSPDDCSLALRGLQSLAVRLERLQESTLAVARWLEAQPEVERVLHPALPGCPGHELWQRDFDGSSSVFSVIFGPACSRAQLVGLIDALELFKIGYSWGGVTSLVMPFFDLKRRLRQYGGSLVRFNVGLESAHDLIEDLERAFARVRRPGEHAAGV
jgi:cystathionine beta-lyase